MTAVGILIVLAAFAGWLRGVWAARPWPVLRLREDERHD